MKQKQTHRYREKTCDCQAGGWWGSLELPSGRVVGEFGISRWKLLWTNNKVLLYSTGNTIEYPVINHNGREYEKVYVCIKLNHFAV